MAKQQCEPYKQGSLGNLLNTMQMLNTVEKDLTAGQRTLLPLLPALVIKHRQHQRGWSSKLNRRTSKASRTLHQAILHCSRQINSNRRVYYNF